MSPPILFSGQMLQEPMNIQYKSSIYLSSKEVMPATLYSWKRVRSDKKKMEDFVITGLELPNPLIPRQISKHSHNPFLRV